MQTRLVKKGFSLIEIMMVLLLLGILIVAFKPAFQPKNQNELYGQSCVNMIHGELVNFLNSAMTSKNLFSGNTSISAERYTITVNEITDTITLGYEKDGTSGIQKIYDLSGGIANSYHCESPQYTVKLKGIQERNMSIQKGFQSQNEIPFLLTTNNSRILTGQTMFILCNEDESICKEIAYIDYDSRAKYISKKLCLTYTGTNDTLCKERDK